MECGTKRKYKGSRFGSEKFCDFSCLREEIQFPLDRTKNYNDDFDIAAGFLSKDSQSK